MHTIQIGQAFVQAIHSLRKLVFCECFQNLFNFHCEASQPTKFSPDWSVSKVIGVIANMFGSGKIVSPHLSTQLLSEIADHELRVP